eukprot:TRINITY_DN11678_c0_g1_i2.p1 TRINITY_DN11678_c0_g1~~TRINITY_DN11678_c0_g1_i2.p1  ORF type:complete len:253 (-),score=25.70 TRINITY_DN11678_c0_g1_i2:26-721(-)
MGHEGDTIHEASSPISLLAVVVIGGSFLAWVVTVLVTQSYWPWFIFPIGVFGMVYSLVEFVPLKQFLRIHFIWFGIINGWLTIIALVTNSNTPWHVIVFFSLCIPLSMHTAWQNSNNPRDRWVSAHFAFMISSSILVYYIWSVTGSGYPWFVIVFFGQIVLFGIHFSLHYYPSNRFVCHLITFGTVHLLLLSVWNTGPSSTWPWFAPSFFAWGTAVAIYYIIFQKQKFVPQ